MVVVITVEGGPVGVLPQMAAGLRVPQTQASLLVSWYAFTVVVAAVPMIRLLGRFDRRLVLVLSMGALAVSTAALTAAHDLPTAICARVVGGLGHAVFFGVGVDIVHRISPTRRLGAAVTVFFAGNVIALAVAVPAVAVFGDPGALSGGWRMTFLIIAGAAGALALLVRLVLPALPVNHVEAGPLVPKPDRAAVAVCVLGMLWLAGHFLAFTLLRSVLPHEGFPDRLVPALLFAFGIGAVAGTVLVGFARQHRLRAHLTTGFGLLCLTQIGLYFAAAAGGRGLVLPAIWASMLLAALWGVAFGAIPALNSTALLRYSRVAPDLTAGMLNSACNIGISLGSFCAGLVYRDIAPTAVFLTAAVVFGVGTLTTRALAREETSTASIRPLRQSSPP